MTSIIRIVERAGGLAVPQPGPEAGLYLESFDHDANDGRGEGTYTPDPDHALRFANAAAAMQYWKRVSTVRPIRPDGKPNRPLTAFTVEIIDT
jgi:hypothetical protein